MLSTFKAHVIKQTSRYCSVLCPDFVSFWQYHPAPVHRRFQCSASEHVRCPKCTVYFTTDSTDTTLFLRLVNIRSDFLKGALWSF